MAQDDAERFREFSFWFMDYVKETGNYSYYDLKAYVVENRPEDLCFFENKTDRAHIAEYLKSAKRTAGAKYKTERWKAMRDVLEKEVKYYGEQEAAERASKKPWE